MESVTTLSKKADREINRVQWYIYTLSMISFVLAFLEGFEQPTPFTLIIHLCVSLSLLCLVPWCFKRPVLVILLCFLILAGVWGAFVLSDNHYARWLGIKIPAFLVLMWGLKAAFKIEKLQRTTLPKAR